MTRSSRGGLLGPLSRPVLLMAGLAIVTPVPAVAQGDGVRIGLSLGGISTVGLTVEVYRGSRSLDLTAGTFSFKDIGLSAVVKQYLGTGRVRGFAGAGLWLVLASPPGERTGAGLVARVPVGLDWRVAGENAVGLSVAANRALAVRRPDPADNRPMNRGIVPLPGLYLRFDAGS